MSSQLGVEFALVALPVLAVKELHASAFEVGAVTDASTAVDVLLALPAGSVGHSDRDEAAGACVCAAAEFGLAFSIVHFHICRISIQQDETPIELMSRMSSFARFFVQGPMPLASLTAGAATNQLGLQSVLLIAVIGACLTALPIIGLGKMIRARVEAVA